MSVCNDVLSDFKNQNVPVVPQPFAILYLILNIFLPGWGSVFAGLHGNHVSTVLIGVIQEIANQIVLPPFCLPFCFADPVVVQPQKRLRTAHNRAQI